VESVSWTIYVVGPCRVNNELLTSYLGAENGAKCIARKTIDAVVNLHDQETDKSKLVL